MEKVVYEIPRPIAFSKIALVDPKSGKPTRAGFKVEGDKKVRVAKKSKEVIAITK